MIVISSAWHGNEATYKYAHKEPTALDMRHMAAMLRRDALACDEEAKRLEDADEDRRRYKDSLLP